MGYQRCRLVMTNLRTGRAFFGVDLRLLRSVPFLYTTKYMRTHQVETLITVLPEMSRLTLSKWSTKTDI